MSLVQAARRATGATSGRRGRKIQTLWSGYGEIVRIHLGGGPDVPASVICKQVTPPSGAGRGHDRKLRSYDVEMAWYRDYAPRCDASCRVPAVLNAERTADGWLFVLEDLDVDYGARGAGTTKRIVAGLKWLAHFHARFLGSDAEGLWPVGTYWHLATRPDEWAAMRSGAVKDAAGEIDKRLSAARFRTLVHGDAKSANFCFSPQGSDCAAVDFQYIGGGCGMKDVAGLLSSCLPSRQLAQRADGLLELYFETLRAAVEMASPAVDTDALEAEWRALYPLAWADYYRFMLGWSPSWAADEGYARRMTERVLASL